MQRTLISIIVILLASFSSATQAQQAPAFLTHLYNPWVDSVMSTLSPEERIAQLFMVAAYSNRGPLHQEEVLEMIRTHKIGGLVFFQGGPGRQVAMINKFQSESRVPLLVAMDAEWGLGMRLDSTISFPFQMTLGAVSDNELIRRMGVVLGKQLKRVGAHVNFAPVVDINSNADNPVINYRSFGENRRNVAEKGIAFMKGLQDVNILATAKHFPGHGDTNSDSHYALPTIHHPLARLDSVELFPFREMIRAGSGGMMVAHLNIPSLDSSAVPSTLSRPIVTDLLRDELGFEGIVFTDAMNMKGVTAGHASGVADKDAILAGNDIIELTEDVPRAIEEIKKALRQGLISQSTIDERCRKMLAVKYWAGLSTFNALPVSDIAREMNSPQAKLLNRKLMEGALTVLKNEGDIIPLRSLDTLRVASVSFGADKTTTFQKALSLYTAVTHFQIPADAGKLEIQRLQSELKRFNLVIGGLHDQGIRPLNRSGFSAEAGDFINELARSDKVIFAVFKNPYTLGGWKDIHRADGLIITYEDNDNAEDLAAQLIFGGVSASGRMPVTAITQFKEGAGVDVQGGIRFAYTLPEDVDMDSEILFEGIDSLVRQALQAKAIPGCQVLVARNRKIVFNKSYGVHTYSDTAKVKTTDLYDLASITKISTSMAALMKLYDEGKFILDATIADYLPKFRNSNKANIPMKDLLTHQGRLIPFIPFYQRTFRKNGSYKWATIRKDSSKRFPIRLTETMFLHRRYPDKIVKGIRKSPLRAEKKYVYSDFFFMLAPRVVESMVDLDFASYLQNNFYAPLGATSVTFNPLGKYPIDLIVPTENDYTFRHRQVHGTVHDENAAMMKGVSGHAGLFANANDLAKLMQMYLDMGAYGGERFIEESTLKEFSRTQFPENDNRRALGFDKPFLKYIGVNNNTAEGAGANSFGHTGFTGTFAWMDPDTGLLYIFLSNRVTPTRDNARLYTLNTRTQIQQIMYDALEVGSGRVKVE